MPIEMKIDGEPLLDTHIFVILSECGVLQSSLESIKNHNDLEPILDLFSRARKEEYEHAIYGYFVPLMRCLGPSPEHCLNSLSKTKLAECKEKNHCHMYNNCRLGLGMPICFEPNVALEVASWARRILRGWADNYYWLIVEMTCQI